MWCNVTPFMKPCGREWRSPPCKTMIAILTLLHWNADATLNTQPYLSDLQKKKLLEPTQAPSIVARKQVSILRS